MGSGRLFERLVARDQRLSDRIAEGFSPWRRAASRVARTGDAIYWMAAAALIFALWPAQRVEIAIVVLAVTVAGAGAWIVKITVKRRRPTERPADGAHWKQSDPYSMPSGHATRMAAMVAVLGLHWPWLGLVLGLWTVLIMVARVAVRAHYLLDVLVGGIMGALAGWAVWAIAPQLVGVWKAVVD